MPTYDRDNTPELNLALLTEMVEYPGRLFVVGFAGGVALLGYALTGRSPGSKNRKLTWGRGVLRAVVADPTRATGDPKLTTYPVIRAAGDVTVISNGRQTNTVIKYLRHTIFERAIRAIKPEPDAPIFTPRITGYLRSRGTDSLPSIGLGMVRRDPRTGGTIRELTYPTIVDGVGYCLQTYSGDAQDVKPYDGPVFTLPLPDSTRAVAEMLWGALNPDYRVSVAAMAIYPSGARDVYIIPSQETA